MQQLRPEDALAFLGRARANGQAPLLLDVREPWECATASIQVDGVRALHIPIGELPARLDELGPKGVNESGVAGQRGMSGHLGSVHTVSLQPIVCICHHGMRSAQVVAFLERQGHTAVYNLAGGIDAWSTRVDPAVPRY